MNNVELKDLKCRGQIVSVLAGTVCFDGTIDDYNEDCIVVKESRTRTLECGTCSEEYGRKTMIDRTHVISISWRFTAQIPHTNYEL